MSAEASGPPVPFRTSPGIRWGLPDVAIAFVVGLVFAVVAGSVVAGVRDIPQNKVGDDIGVLMASVVAQAAGVVIALATISRLKGQRSLRRDFGLVLWWRSGVWLLVGIGLQFVATSALAPIAVVYGRNESQGVVTRFESARGWELALFALLVVLVAPVAEELLFRGVLLRSLLRRTTAAWAIFLSALVFALIHPLSDPSIGSVIAVPGLFGLGLVAGGLAVRTRDLSASILLHAGFNLVTAIFIISTR